MTQEEFQKTYWQGQVLYPRVYEEGRPADHGDSPTWTCEMSAYQGKPGKVLSFHSAKGTLGLEFADKHRYEYKYTWLRFEHPWEEEARVVKEAQKKIDAMFAETFVPTKQ